MAFRCFNRRTFSELDLIGTKNSNWKSKNYKAGICFHYTSYSSLLSDSKTIIYNTENHPKKSVLKPSQKAVFRILICRFLGLPDPFVRGTVSRSESFHNQAKIVKKNLDLNCFVTSSWLFIYEEWCKCTLQKVISKNLNPIFVDHFCPSRIRIAIPDLVTPLKLDPIQIRIWIHNTAAMCVTCKYLVSREAPEQTR